MVRIITLMDDKPTEHLSLIAEHGLSYYVERNGSRLLFDCGASDAPQRNAHRLGVDLKELDAVILSHSHYDHAAGYRDLIENGLGADALYTGPHFFEPKYAKAGIRCTDLSAGFDLDFVQKHGVAHRTVEDVMEIAPGVWVITGFPRTHAFETIPDRFVRRVPGGFVQDDFPDEVCVALQVEGGVVVLVGCSHPGILNMISHVKTVLNQPVKAVYGGTHLMEADDARIETTIRELRGMGLETLGLSHCSGDSVECALRGGNEMDGCHMGSGDTVFYD